MKSFFVEKGRMPPEAERMFNYYEASDWRKAKGEKVKNWKLAAVGWIGRSNISVEDEIQRDFDNRKSDLQFEKKYNRKILKKYLFASL